MRLCLLMALIMLRLLASPLLLQGMRNRHPNQEVPNPAQSWFGQGQFAAGQARLFIKWPLPWAASSDDVVEIADVQLYSARVSKLSYTVESSASHQSVVG